MVFCIYKYIIYPYIQQLHINCIHSQLSALSSFFQATGFDPDTRTFWWIGTPDYWDYDLGFYSFQVDNDSAIPIFHDWSIYSNTEYGGGPTISRHVSQIRFYNGYLYLGEKLKSGLVRWDINTGIKEYIISLDDYQYNLVDGDTSAVVTPNLGGFDFDPTTDLIYFSIHDNFGRYPARIFSRHWNQTSIEPYTEYEIGTFSVYSVFLIHCIQCKNVPLCIFVQDID